MSSSVAATLGSPGYRSASRWTQAASGRSLADAAETIGSMATRPRYSAVSAAPGPWRSSTLARSLASSSPSSSSVAAIGLMPHSASKGVRAYSSSGFGSGSG